MANAFFDFQLKDVVNALILIVTICAIVYGPISAFKISKIYNEEEEKRKRQHEVFYILMKTRRLHLTAERVGALNTIQLNFYGAEKILQSYKNYVDHLELSPPGNSKDQAKFLERREDIFYDLLFEMGKYLKFSFDRREMRRLAYLPEGWNTDEQEARNFRKYVIELLAGRRGLPVEKFRASKINEKFPPPP